MLQMQESISLRLHIRFIFIWTNHSSQMTAALELVTDFHQDLLHQLNQKRNFHEGLLLHHQINNIHQYDHTPHLHLLDIIVEDLNCL